MPLLEVSRVSKSFDGVMAVDDVSLSAEQGEVVCLLGPSGCGKTTLLRLVAGLEAPDRGAIVFDGRSLEGVAPRERGFGLMFQDLALFPHMDVYGNVSFGLRMQGRSRAEVEARVGDLLEMVGLAGFGRRKVHQLSGGERQRVALARSLAPEPRLLMFDEPLGSLDRGLRESLQAQVRSILKEVDVTALYVTHDRDEAFAMADSMVVMDGGRVAQAGAPETLFRSPGSALVARSMGLRNVMLGAVRQAGAQTTVACDIGDLPAPSLAAALPIAGGEALAIVDERRVLLVAPGASDADAGIRLEGVVESRRFHAGEIEVVLRVGAGHLVCLLQPDLAAPEVGNRVAAAIPPDALRLIPQAPQTGAGPSI